MTTAKKPYQGKNKNKSTSSTQTFKKPYAAPEFATCKVCRVGLMRPTQWNRVLCSSTECTNSELV